MVSLEDIFSFMKQDKLDRAEQRKQDMLERAQQREEDLNLIKEMINEGVKAEVLSAMEPICRRQEELEEKHKNLQDKLNDMSEEIKRLKIGGSKVQTKGVDNHKVDEEVGDLVIEGEKGSKGDIVAAARRTIGLHQIGQADVEKYSRSGINDKNEAMVKAVREFMLEEMKVSEDILEEMHIEKVFPPAREDWRTLYVKFVSESSVHKLYSHARNMKANLRLIPYIPKEFYMRYRELESQAFKLRHSEVKYKTRIKMGTSDLVLYKRKSNQTSWNFVESAEINASKSNVNSETFQLNLRPNSGYIIKPTNPI